MRIHRSHPRERFTIIPDDTHRDPQLSYAARGLLGELLSRPPDWHETADELAVAARKARGEDGEGRDKMRGLFAELRAAGYLVYTRRHGPGGRMMTEIDVYDRPQDR